MIESLFCGVREHGFSVGLKLALREEVRLGRLWTAPAPTPALDDMHCFRKLRLRLRAPKGAGPGKSQQFF